MSARRWKLVAANESTVVPKSLLDVIMIEDGESNGRLPDPRGTNESDGLELFSEVNDLLDNFVASEASSR